MYCQVPPLPSPSFPGWDDPSLSKGCAQDRTFISAALLIKCKSWHVLFSGNSDVVLSEGGIWTTTNLSFVHIADEMKMISQWSRWCNRCVVFQKCVNKLMKMIVLPPGNTMSQIITQARDTPSVSFQFNAIRCGCHHVVKHLRGGRCKV